jgi:predicted GNAT family acetyltransferase
MCRDYWLPLPPPRWHSLRLMACQLEVYRDELEFSAWVGGWLEEHEAENSLFLGLLGALVEDPPEVPPFMARATTSDGKTVAAAFHRGFALLLSRGPDEAIDAIAARLGALGVQVPAVIGPARESERFARAWSEAQGCDAQLTFDQRIYQLTELRRPQPIAGSMRAIVIADIDLVVEWTQAFDLEALSAHERRPLVDARRHVANRIGGWNLFGWDLDGELVAMAGLARPTVTTISVNSVYTPPAHRRRGFATALVAAVSDVGMKRGKTACVLYTDLGNPTSNAIYQKIGYHPVCYARNYHFGPPR